MGVCVDRLYTIARAQLLWVGSRNVVSDSAGFSITNAVVLPKYDFSFRAFVLLKLLASLISCVVACSVRIETDRQTDRQTHCHTDQVL